MMRRMAMGLVFVAAHHPMSRTFAPTFVASLSAIGIPFVELFRHWQGSPL
jgi:hypothetical protein